ncbi:galactokinase [Pseudoflavonifractor phocaeensis]|uniref:galactokinase n=1 Tax=Pseudoflavonifractor phocaeensis TaxID=1870988 RepID=UPI001F34633D|nr:galactokinase family protein [Pseudoflavonifractor phocaeensis]MCF2660871.1 galactokinase [Pseudoflavonifractor phocaeensis]
MTKEHFLISAPGRTEISGNHTDHQRGCVLAAAVNLETVADVTLNGSNNILVRSDGYPDTVVELDDLNIREEEKNTTAALIRGVAAAFVQRGARLKGFDAEVHSTVLPGSGLSSSAAFEVLMGTICNELFFDRKLSAVEIAQIGQYAENVYFGKPSGLMDQAASSVGGMVYIDFADPENPQVERIEFDFEKAGHALCIIDSGADHADLTDEYAAIPRELKEICRYFEKDVLREVREEEFMEALPNLRGQVSDRAILRAIHFYQENKRVQEQKKALQENDFDAFLRLTTQSGYSSWMYLQNIMPAGAIKHQEMALALALCDTILQGKGAYRVHGGGFAGTVQAFVPLYMLEDFKINIERVLGDGSCHVLRIRNEGGVRLR